MAPEGDDVELATKGIPATQTPLHIQRSGLYENLVGRFNEEELRTLCFGMGVEYESLPAQGKAGKAREFLALLERTGCIPELIEKCRTLRPNISWEDTLAALQTTPKVSPRSQPEPPSIRQTTESAPRTNTSSVDARTPVIAIVAIVAVALVTIFVAAIVFRPGKPIGLVSSPAPSDTPTSTATSTPTQTATPTAAPSHTPTRMPTPIPTGTPTIDPTLQGAVPLIDEMNSFICNKLENLQQHEDMWCQKSVQELQADNIEQQTFHWVFFTYQEGPVMGQKECLRLLSKYFRGIESGGFQICAVERWAYLPEEMDQDVRAFVHITMCNPDVGEGQLHSKVCMHMLIWYNNHIARNQWENVDRGSFWPTPVPAVGSSQ